MSKGNLTLIFNHFEFNYQHLNKDVFLIPYNLGKKLGYDVTIVYPLLPENQNLPFSHRGVKLERVKFRKNLKFLPFWKHINFYIYILRRALHIDVLVRFHLSTHTEFIIILFKLLNPSGRSYLKLDINEDTIDLFNSNLKKTLKRSIHNKVSKIFINKVDVISCETTKTLSKIKSSINPNLNFGHKLILIPNGVDNEIVKFKTRDYIEKLIVFWNFPFEIYI